MVQIRSWVLEGLRKTRKKTHPCGLGLGHPWPQTVLRKPSNTQDLDHDETENYEREKRRYGIFSLGKCADCRTSFRDRLWPGTATAEPTWMCLLRVPERRPGNCTRIQINNAAVFHDHIRITPNVDSSIGAFSAAEIDRPSTILVSAGSITPSSHSRAEA